jgi:hypothetical protein
MRQSITTLFLATLTCGLMTGQDTPSYLDVFTARVKPDKRAEFDAINKKMAALNRRNKGDTWLATETMYGEGNVVTFTSLRSGFGDVQKAFDLFLGAMAKPGGMAAAMKMLQDSNSPLVNGRSEIRLRRPDLGTNAPTSAADTAALIGKARFQYMVTVRVRTGHGLGFEDQIKMVRDVRKKAGQKQVWLVSQSIVGQPGTLYYITMPLGSLDEMDGAPTLSRTLGADGYKQFQKGLAENTLSTEITINRYLPELSNPPAEIAAADPAFWNPKPAPPK